MKKLRQLCICLFTLTVMATLNSCDEDVSRSVTLSGEWYGDFGMYYYYGDRRFDSYDTRIVFYPDYNYATHGYGKQVDYYEYGPYAYQYYRFNWYIDRGDLVLEYPYDPDLNTVIHDYQMSNYYFRGYFGNSNTRFSLRKISDFYDWGAYDESYGFGWNSGWDGGYPYAYTRTSCDTDSLSTTSPMPQEDTNLIKRGNRFNPNRSLDSNLEVQ